MNVLKKTGKIFFNTIFIVIILFTMIFMYGFIRMKATNTQYVNIFGYTIMQVATGSMEDTIQINDIVIVKLTKNIDNNDIITYEENDKLITHRVIDIKGDKIQTKGDANSAKDKPINKDVVVGKVIFIIHKVGIWQKVLTSPQVIISFTITVCLLYIIFTKKDKRKE